MLYVAPLLFSEDNNATKYRALSIFCRRCRERVYHGHMKKILLIALLVGVAGVLLVMFFPREDVAVDDASHGTPSTPIVFDWDFVEAETLNLDGLPQTEVYLSIADDRKLIDIVDGGCSEIPDEKYELDISTTGKVQCYYGGLGQQYRIVKDGDAFVVERKIFEEALPDAAPLEHEWEVVTTL